MSNGEFCCAVGLCCPPESASRRSALISELSHNLPVGADASDEAITASDAVLGHVADWLIANVDMAPKGTLDLSKVKAAFKGHEVD